MATYATAQARKECFSANFAWFWYNDEEIFHDTQAELDRKMKVLADQGITHVMTFSCTHYRWSFRPWWPQILECLRKIAVAGHKYGIKVIEHCSAVLSWFPDSEERKKVFLIEQNIRKSNPDNWPGLWDYMLDTKREDYQWDQVSIVTGERIFTGFNGYTKCLNNPDYLKSYLEYLTLVCQTGVDGIMTDDARFYIASCGCKHCREKFKRLYGREVPTPEEFDKWNKDMTNPAFIDYRHFIDDSQQEYFQAIHDHFDKLGYNMLRPNYDAIVMGSFRYIDAPDDIPHIDWYFQECMFSAVIRYSWHGFIQEQVHRAKIARERDIPHMMMFYATREDSLVFAWGIAKYCGALFNNTPEGGAPPDETQIRNFEKKYGDWLFDSKEVPGVAFLDSKANRRYNTGYMESRRLTWMQACIFHNIPRVIVNANNPETWNEHPLICANEVHLLSEKQIKDLLAYAENGGILVLTGRCGQMDEKSRFRTEEERSKLWGIDFTRVPSEGMVEISKGKGKIVAVGWDFGYPGTVEENRLRFDDDPRRWQESYITPRQELLECIVQRWDTNGETVARPPVMEEDSHYYRMKPYYAQVADLFTRLLNSRLCLESELPELVVASLKQCADGKNYSVHLVNAVGTYHQNREARVSHADVIEFPELAGDGRIKVRLPAAKGIVATFCDLHQAPVALETSLKDGVFEITIPLQIMKDYGLIKIEIEQ